MTELERDYVDTVLSAEFSGNIELRRQLDAAMVRDLDEDGSVEFIVDSTADAPITVRVPVEAEAPDADGVPIVLLLHVLKGKMAELEIYKADGSSIQRMPTPSELQVTTNSS
jgi:hypothetical protein